MKQYVSFSGGKDSTAMLLKMIELGEPIDKVVYFDNGLDYPEMLEHVNKVESYLNELSITFQRVYPKLSFEDGLRKYCMPSARRRWCTYEKTTALKRAKEKDATYCVGIAYDEQYRLNRKTNEKNRHPLVEWHWTEKDCLEYCYQKGYDFGGLYNIYDRVSCWCCPLQPLADLRKLYFTNKKLFLRLKEFEKISGNTLRLDYSVDELIIRFELEKLYIKNGLTISMQKGSSFRKEFDVLIGRDITNTRPTLNVSRETKRRNKK